LEFATFDCACECLIVAGTMKTRIESDSAKPIEKHDDSSATGTRMEVDAAKENEKPASTAYVWSQTPDDVTAIFLVDETVKKIDVGFSISAQSIHLNVKDTVLLGGQLGGVVSVDECTWVIENGRIELTLFKEAGRLVWTELVMGDNRGQYQSDPGLLADVAERLAKFTSDKPALGTDGIVQNFNSGELEECDMAEDDSCTMQWIHGETHRVVAEADISGRQILFTARLAPDSPLCFCVRHDVDGILWEFSGDKRRPVVHRATFHALGYVQASKQQRRFTSCPPNGAYSTIIESQKHAFVYWQPAAIDGDLRNRKNGRRVASVAKQQLINLVEEGDRSKGSIVGAIATDNTLFLLTERNLYAIVVVENTSGRVPE